MKHTSKIALIALALAAMSCTSKPPVAKHVIFIGFDGLSSEAFKNADMPNAKAMMSEGCYTLQKRATFPTSSAINWASMFMGAGPELHGYTKWGSKTPELPSRVVNKNNIFPTIFQLLRDSDPEAEIGVLYDWSGIKYLVDTLSLNYMAKSKDMDANPLELGDMAAEYIKAKKPNLLAVCFDNPDHMGHKYGWESDEYNAMLTTLDSSIATIVEAAREAGIYDDTVFIVTSDHGGINKGHGGITMNEVETPFIIWGKGIAKNGEMDDSIMQYDVAATIAEIMGISDLVPQVWIGRPMREIR